MKVFGTFLIILGSLSLTLGSYLIWQRNNPNRVAFSNTQVFAGTLESDPVRLVINSQGIDLPIIESKVENYKWEVTDIGVSRIGNVFYGHNWTNLLGNLVKVKPGDVIEVKYSDGSTKKYKVTITQIVDPDQKDVLNFADEDTILIYTCTGFLDSKRFIVVASEI